MQITRAGSQPSRKGPAEYFTGDARIDPLFQAPDPARVGASNVTFEPGARTAWHTHPLGQTLTKEQAGEVLTHLAFHVGWPDVFSALPVFKDVLEKR